MSDHYTMEIAVATDDLEGAQELARSSGGICYSDPREPWDYLPFRALVSATTDNMDTFTTSADVGRYLICRRTIKAGDAGAIGVFPLVHHPELSHTQADAHWRDTHAPLALVHHAHMTHYTQLSVVHRFSGLEVDGFALCGFANEEDLRDRFYTQPESIKVIASDVSKFADGRKSPRRLIATMTSYA